MHPVAWDSSMCDSSCSALNRGQRGQVCMLLQLTEGHFTASCCCITCQGANHLPLSQLSYFGAALYHCSDTELLRLKERGAEAGLECTHLVAAVHMI